MEANTEGRERGRHKAGGIVDVNVDVRKENEKGGNDDGGG